MVPQMNGTHLKEDFQMSDSVPKQIEPSELLVLGRTARLELTSERRAVVAPALDGILGLLDALDAVDLGETPPTNSFDPRWRDLP